MMLEQAIEYALAGEDQALVIMARPEGFEPPTYGFVVRRSIR